MEQADIRKQILLYYAGQLMSAEKQRLLQDLGMLTEEELQQHFPLSEWEEAGDAALPEADVQAALHRHQQLRRGKKSIRFRWYAAAACLASAVAISGYYGWKNDTARSKAIALKTIQARNGQQRAVTLSDGSRVIIQGGTTIQVPEDFQSGERTIFLREGEAFFDIKSDPEKPFIVRSENLAIQVLGTSFNVRDYSDEKESSVTVRTGKVAVSSANTSLQLVPGGKASLDKARQTLQAAVIDTTAEFGWMRQEYVFRSETLRNIIRRLQHGYNVTFRVEAEALLERKFSATFRQNTITGIMEQLRLMGNIKYRTEGDTIIIHP